MNQLNQLQNALKKLGNAKRAADSARFFKTSKGQYGEGDVFLGITVPVQRQIARQYLDLPLTDTLLLLKSKYHEYRFAALEILVGKFEIGNVQMRKAIYNFYISHARSINNWDLVDTSARAIAGSWLMDHSKLPLYKLARSSNLWEKRIAIVATHEFIIQGQYVETLKISKILFSDSHDLLHKAVGWMLREVGKKDQKVLEQFLKENYTNIPRTTLRYAIERFPEKLRKRYLSGVLK